jgi:hypothetical protein
MHPALPPLLDAARQVQCSVGCRAPILPPLLTCLAQTIATHEKEKGEERERRERGEWKKKGLRVNYLSSRAGNDYFNGHGVFQQIITLQSASQLTELLSVSIGHTTPIFLFFCVCWPQNITSRVL